MLHAIEDRGRDLERRRTVGCNVEFVFAAKGKRLEVQAGDNRRIDNRIERFGRKRDRVGLDRLDGQGRAELPALRQRERGVDVGRLDLRALRIDDHVAELDQC
jgi:hypothetical protein